MKKWQHLHADLDAMILRALAEKADRPGALVARLGFPARVPVNGVMETSSYMVGECLQWLKEQGKVYLGSKMLWCLSSTRRASIEYPADKEDELRSFLRGIDAKYLND